MAVAPANTGGRRSAQGRACSSWAATRISRSSRPKGATSWTPIGSPSSVQCSGSEIAGWPVTLKSAVKLPSGARAGSPPSGRARSRRRCRAAAAARPASGSAAGRSRRLVPAGDHPASSPGGRRRRRGTRPRCARCPLPRAPRSAARRRPGPSSRPRSVPSERSDDALARRPARQEGVDQVDAPRTRSGASSATAWPSDSSSSAASRVASITHRLGLDLGERGRS